MATSNCIHEFPMQIFALTSFSFSLSHVQLTFRAALSAPCGLPCGLEALGGSQVRAERELLMKDQKAIEELPTHVLRPIFELFRAPGWSLCTGSIQQNPSAKRHMQTYHRCIRLLSGSHSRLVSFVPSPPASQER